MSTTTVANSIAVDVAADNALAAQLNHPRADVAAALRVAINKGLEIKSARIRYQEDLDAARAAKLQWTQASIDLLHALFDNTSVADYCNDWVGKIFPEYAEFGNFVEQFYEEMDHRLGKLRSVLRRVEQVPAAAPAAPAEAPIVLAAPTVPQSNTPVAAAPVAPAPAPAAAAPAVAVTRPAAPIGATTSTVVLLGAAATDPAHSAAADLLKGLGIASRFANDVFSCDAATGAAVFLLSSQPADPAAERVALFKLGCAAGRLGASRVCVLHAPGVRPLVESGVHHIAADPAGAWQLQLARHLKQAGLNVDLNKLF